MSTAILQLRIENTYESGRTVITTATATVLLPLPAEDSDERSDWEYDNIYQHTGTGRTEGDAWYDVEVVGSTEPELLGLTFEFGY